MDKLDKFSHFLKMAGPANPWSPMAAVAQHIRCAAADRGLPLLMFLRAGNGSLMLPDDDPPIYLSPN